MWVLSEAYEIIVSVLQLLLSADNIDTGLASAKGINMGVYCHSTTGDGCVGVLMFF
jgi:hypothetical protein